MAKGRLLDDTFEQLIELGQSTVKQTVKSVAKTFNPLSVFETSNSSSSDNNQQLKEKLSKQGSNHTPLNFDKLNKNYQDQEKIRQQALRNRLFQLIKQEEQQSVERDKQKKEETKRSQLYQAEEKKRQEALKKQQEQQEVIPRGKIRKSIFSPKKVAEKTHAETKPSLGKQ